MIKKARLCMNEEGDWLAERILKTDKTLSQTELNLELDSDYYPSIATANSTKYSHNTLYSISYHSTALSTFTYTVLRNSHASPNI
jgi:hypothetical protein